MFQFATVPPKLKPLFEQELFLAPNSTKHLIKAKLHNGVKIYGDIHAVAQLAQLVANYTFIWESESFMQITLEYWIKSPLKPDWKAKVSTIQPKVYLLVNKNG